jgi:hypothetical protein
MQQGWGVSACERRRLEHGRRCEAQQQAGGWVAWLALS